MPRFCSPWLILAIVTLSSLVLGACASLPTVGPLPSGVSLSRLTQVDAATPLVWSPDGRRLAFVREGLRLRDLGSGNETVLEGPVPAVLAWSADGAVLALAFSEATGTLLQLRPLAGAQPPTTLQLPGQPAGLFWNGREVILCTSELRRYSFGGNLLTRVIRWNGSAAPQIATLHDVTLKPLTLRDWNYLLPALHPALAPWGDALLYTRLHDPPEFSPYLKLVWRHLESGEERVIADLNLLSAGGRFVGIDEQIVVAEGRNETRRIDLDSMRVADVLPVAGKVLATSPGGRHLLVDGQLWQDGTLLLTLRDIAAAAFSPRGDQLLLRVDQTLYLLSGLAPDPLPQLPAGPELERLLLLRRWRAMDLISPAEYRIEKGATP